MRTLGLGWGEAGKRRTYNGGTPLCSGLHDLHGGESTAQSDFFLPGSDSTHQKVSKILLHLPQYGPGAANAAHELGVGAT